MFAVGQNFDRQRIIVACVCVLAAITAIFAGGGIMFQKNRLASEKSPYLLQHAHNPVDWYPWGAEAFEKARKEDKPIFLSIGYSTCHWCHVMEQESFEDPEVAQRMNDAFVSIKVDREERPDIDQIYMTVCQMMTGSGGWPLTIIMTSDKKPFFAGTYIPKENRFGRTGMLQLVPHIQELWKKERQKLLNSAEELTRALAKTSERSMGGELGVSTLQEAYQQLVTRFDAVHGGFGEAPKFPTPHNFFFLLRYWNRTGSETALEMVEKTLQKMRAGGIYDHIGFGFHRYSTDSEWRVPHFEKMLYDQAMLALAYTEAYQATGKVEYRKTAEEIFTYVLRDMTSPDGGFYSAEDADSEGEEGKFYTYTKEEREKRIRPHKDDKILTDWNGLMIAALAKGGQVFENREYTEAALRATKFILEKLRRSDGRLLHRFREGESAITGHLNDYAFLVWGLIELYEATFDTHYLQTAMALNAQQLKHFWDSKDGGFFFTANDAEELIARPKEIYDGALPSGNSVALLNLLRLSRMTADTTLEEKATRLSRAFSSQIQQSPSSFTQFLTALDFAFGPSFEIVVAGKPGAEDSQKLLGALRSRFIPNKVVLFRPTTTEKPAITELARFTESQTAMGGKATAYVCQNYNCKLPTTDPDEMLKQLRLRGPAK